ncbi:MAG: orotate phosphoribosyltransferase [Candidatus Omnitrophota bacterium]
MNKSKLIEIFERYGAYQKDHFLLSSGLHSEWYLQCALVLAHPKIAAKLCNELAKKFSAKGGSASGGSGKKIDVVIGPALGGIVVAYEVARAVGVKGIFAEREEGKMVLRRGFKINPDDRVLVVEDVTTTGGSVKEVIDLMRSYGAKIVGVGAIIDRSSGKVEFGIPFKTLVKLNIKTYQPENCPLCKKGIPAIRPGSRK